MKNVTASVECQRRKKGVKVTFHFSSDYTMYVCVCVCVCVFCLFVCLFVCLISKEEGEKSK